MTEHVLVWHPKVQGDVPAAAVGDDQLRLIGMPTGLVRPARQALAADQLTPAAREIMDAVVADLQRRIETPDAPPMRFRLKDLDEDGKAAIADILGEGDVWAKVGVGNAFWRIVESVLAGVWRLEEPPKRSTSICTVAAASLTSREATAKRSWPGFASLSWMVTVVLACCGRTPPDGFDKLNGNVSSGSSIASSSSVIGTTLGPDSPSAQASVPLAAV